MPFHRGTWNSSFYPSLKKNLIIRKRFLRSAKQKCLQQSFLQLSRKLTKGKILKNTVLSTFSKVEVHFEKLFYLWQIAIDHLCTFVCI
jgi:hypothetical protein